MKLANFLYVLILAFVVVLSSCNSEKKNEADQDDNLKGKISIAALPEDYVLANSMATAFTSIHNSVVVDVTKIELSDAENALANKNYNMVLVNGLINPFSEYECKTVAKDALVLCVNFDNPVLQKIAINGIRVSVLKNIFAANNSQLWSSVYKCEEKDSVKFFLAENSTAANIVKKYLKTDNGSTVNYLADEISVYNSIASNVGGIGFLSSSVAYDHNTEMRSSGIYIVSLDINENGTADNDELIYDFSRTLNKNVYAGKFPKELVRNHYLVYGKDAMENEVAKSFVEWAEDNSQTPVKQSGFIFNKQEINKQEK